ncbi:glycosyltransferase family 39 protein [Patescibacteria group bacterium]|nr:glycosyltransferase family 39 protein [Patescibacteria group bacterium]
MKNKVQLDWQIISLIFLIIVFFFVYSFLAIYQLPKNINDNLIFNSPDETANYYFAYTFAKQSELQFKDSANQIADDLAAPRSMRVINNNTVPATFIGFPLIAGTLAKIFTLKVIPFVLIIFACLAIFFFYLLIKEIFNKQIAFISALLLLIAPAWWYYATKSLMPNVLFVALLIISMYLFIKAIKSAKIPFYLLFGFFIGLALMVRTSEITWLLPLFIILLVIYRKKINWANLALSFIVCLLSFAPVFYFNFQNYQSIFSFGYAVDLELQGKDIITQSLNIFEKIFLPFGFQPRTALINFYNYTLKMFPVWSIISLLGFLIAGFFILLKKDKKRILYLALFLLISGYLVIYYGSWSFHDNPDPQAITIGNSYVRYWLPVYVFILPLIGYSLFKFLKKSKLAVTFVTAVLFIVLGYFSFQQVYFGQDEGIYLVYNNLKSYEQIQSQVSAKIEDNAIIVADIMDKVFFPRRSVIFRLNKDYDYQRVYQLIAAGYPVYYFYFTRHDALLAEFNERYFFQHQLEVQPSIVDFKEQSLYPIRILNSEF